MHVSIHWTQEGPAARQPIVTRLSFCHAMEWKYVMNDETSREIERQIHTQTHFGRRFWYRCWACNGFPSISSIVLLPLHGFSTEHINYNRKCKPYMYRIWVEHSTLICTRTNVYHATAYTRQSISALSLKNKTLYIVWQLLDFSFILNENLL